MYMIGALSFERKHRKEKPVVPDILLWPAQPEGTAILIRVAWLGVVTDKIVLAHFDRNPA